MKLGGIHFYSNAIINQIHMADNNHSYVEEPQLIMDHEKKSYLNTLMKRKYEENFGQVFVYLKKSHEKDLSMGKITEEILFEAACSGICLSKGWVGKYITKMNIYGCTMLACMDEALFDI